VRGAPAAEPLLWTKLAVNAAINPLSAILGLPNGELLRLPGARAQLIAAAAEVGVVAQAAGIALPVDPVARALQVAEATAPNRSSMLQDVEAGRRTEIEAITGAVVARAEALGVPVPVNRELLAQVRALGR
jgi:2-dehydropantoate 2-reductase